jgi:hypothetical protein
MDNLSSAVIAHTLRRDPPRFDASGAPIPKVKVEVDCVASGLVECGIPFEVGVHTYEVYEDEVAHLEEKVESATPDDLARVRADHEGHLADAREAAKTGADVPDRSALPSLAYSFRRIMRRDMRPFRSVKRVVEKKAQKTA